MRLLTMIALAGAAGALSRYGISTAMSKAFSGSDFPFGTLTVNVIGCFLIGIVMHIGLNTDIIPPDWRTAVTMGFLGALTTFSSFSYETIQLIENSKYSLVAANITANVIAALLATIAGIMLSKTIIGGS
jgi:fluoride exporter